MKKVLVISLGGSLIIPHQMDILFLERFRATLRRHYSTHKFVIVCGGGSVARKYIDALAAIHRSHYAQSLAGISATRMNAHFLMQFFGKEANDLLPQSMKAVRGNLGKNNVVLCGALRYVPDSTSDSTAARLAQYLKTEFINMTDIDGLYTADPRKELHVKLIPSMSWKKFEELACSKPYRPGQHFVLDQKAARLIRAHRIPTYIIGKKLINLHRIIRGKSFKGTCIAG